MWCTLLEFVVCAHEGALAGFGLSLALCGKGGRMEVKCLGPKGL